MRKVDFDTFCNIKIACIAQTTSPNGLQLPSETKTAMRKTEKVDDMFVMLAGTPYWSWIELRLFETMAHASQLPQMVQLLENYTAAIFPRKIIDILPDIPTKEDKMQYYKKVVSKIQTENDMTVADLVKHMSQLKQVILDICGGQCLLDHVKEGCLEIHCWICSTIVDHAFNAASMNRDKFHELKLQQIKIGSHPVIKEQPSMKLSPDLSSMPL